MCVTFTLWPQLSHLANGATEPTQRHYSDDLKQSTSKTYFVHLWNPNVLNGKCFSFLGGS